MWPFNSSDDDGCTAHHWGEETISWRRSDLSTGTKRVDGRTIDCVFIEARHVRHCQHDGCDASDYTVGPMYAVPMNTLFANVGLTELHDAVEDLKEQ